MAGLNDVTDCGAPGDTGGWSLLDFWVHRRDDPKACLVTQVEHRRERSLRGIWCRKWPLCEFPLLSWKRRGVPEKWKGFTCFRKSYQPRDDELLQGSPGVSVGHKERQKRGWVKCLPKGQSCIPKCPQVKRSVPLPFRGESVIGEAKWNNH